MVVIPSRMGKLNKRALLGHLQRLGAASRADLAKSLGMSQPTAGKIVDELLESGVFEEVEMVVNGAKSSAAKARLKVGRPARMIRLNQGQPRFLGIQLGVRETTLAQLPVGGGREDRWDHRFATPDSGAAWLKQLRQAAGLLAQRQFWGVLVSVPGLVDVRQGSVIYSPNLHWTERLDLSALIRKVWDGPVILVQEEHALALGHQAADPEGEDFLLADFGDGVGGAVVVAGKLFVHLLPISGEFGHTPIFGNDRACGCGAVGCLETLASTRGLLQSFAAQNLGARCAWPALVESVTARGVAPWLAPVLDATARVIAGALNVLGLRRVVITGTFNELPPVVLAYLAKSICRGALWARFGEVKVEGAPRRRTAGLVAVGLDHLVVPVHETERSQESLFRAHRLHG